MTEGAFVAFEGLDGAGTTTQARRARRFVAEETDRRPALSAEPTDGPIGSQIRQSLSGRLDFDPETLALLFAADRVDHCRTEIRPRLEDGAVVLVDRYDLSSLAYQRAEADLEPSWLRRINDRAIEPDLTVFLDVPPSVCVERMAADRWSEERFEDEDTLERVYDAYLDAIERERSSGRDVRTVDGTRPEDAVAEDVVDLLSDVI